MLEEFNLLMFLIFCPIAAGLLCLFMPDRLKALTKLIAGVVTLASLGLSIFIFINKPMAWGSGLHTIFIADNLSAFIAIAISVFGLLVTIYSFGFIEKAFGRYFGYVLMTLGSSFGAVYANDLIALTVFWGFLAVLLYLMVSMKDTDRALSSAKKALIMIGGTDAAMLFGIGLIWATSGTFTMSAINLKLDSAFSYLAYFSIVAAAFAKAGAMPFHSWLPDVAEDGPIPVTAYLPASLDKLLGIYLLARVSLSLFVMNDITNLVLLISGSLTIVLAVIFALVQHDMKKLLGYHAVSQVGYMVLGIGTGNPIGIAGGIFHMLNHAIYKSCLFLSAGCVEKKAGTTDLAKLGGLAKFMPVTFACFLVASLSISGIPPFNGFVSKWMIYQGIVELGAGSHVWIFCLVAAMFGSALTVASFMKLLHAVFLGRKSESLGDVKEAGLSMLIPIAVLAILCLALGVFAFTFPLPDFIFPALGLSPNFLGVWKPVAATVLLAIGIIFGFLAYALIKTSKFRVTGTFIGGEDPAGLARVTGTEFYDTISDMKGLGALCNKESRGELDIYIGAKKAVLLLARSFQRLHNGILPTYLVWVLLGMAALFVYFYFR